MRHFSFLSFFAFLILYVKFTPCASGKSFLARHYAIDRASVGEFIIIVCPTRQLCNETGDYVRTKSNQRVSVIHEKVAGYEGKVFRSICEIIKQPDTDGHILIFTQKSFEKINFDHITSKWEVIRDEVPDVYVSYLVRCSQTHKPFTDCVKLESLGDGYARLVATDRDALYRIAENEFDDALYRQLEGVAYKLLAPDWDVYVRVTFIEALLRNEGPFECFCVLNDYGMSRWKKVTTLSANIGDTLFYKLAPKRIIFKDRVDFTGLQFEHHENGNLITIYYAFDSDFSKTMASRDDNKPLKEMCDAARALFKDEPFAFIGNKTDTNGNPYPSPFSDCPNAIELPHVSHGLNCYKHLHNVVVTSAYNYRASEIEFLKSRGLTTEEIRCSMTYQKIYQTACRISIRDIEDKHPKIIIVPDHSTAQYLQRMFPGSEVKSLEIVQPVKAKRGRKPKEGPVTPRQMRRRKKAIADSKTPIVS